MVVISYEQYVVYNNVTTFYEYTLEWCILRTPTPQLKIIIGQGNYGALTGDTVRLYLYIIKKIKSHK